MKVYTKTGDTGTTALFGGTRVPKHHIRIESYGTVDELNSHIGLIRDQDMSDLYKNVLIEIQDRLFTVGAILATPPEKETLKNGQPRLQNLGIIESDIDKPCSDCTYRHVSDTGNGMVFMDKKSVIIRSEYQVDQDNDRKRNP